MSYTPTTDFSVKDALPALDPGKYIYGADLDTEFNAIATAISATIGSTTGTFSANLPGITTTVSTSFKYAKTGASVTIIIPSLTSGTSNSTSLSFPAGTLPAAIRPATAGASVCSVAQVYDNGTPYSGVVAVYNTGQLTFYKDASLGAFTASGTKGVGSGTTFTYVVL